MPTAIDKLTIIFVLLSIILLVLVAAIVITLSDRRQARRDAYRYAPQPQVVTFRRTQTFTATAPDTETLQMVLRHTLAQSRPLQLSQPEFDPFDSSHALSAPQRQPLDGPAFGLRQYTHTETLPDEIWRM